MSTDMTREEGLAMHREAEARRLYNAINAAASSVAGASVIIDRAALLGLIAAERALERECVAAEAEVSAIIDGDHPAIVERMGFEPDTREGATAVTPDRFVARLVYPKGPPDDLSVAVIFQQRPVRIVEIPNAK